MSTNLLNGLTMNPNYHEFGPSLMENELAKIATGGRAGLAYSMLHNAHQQREEDNQTYYDRLDKGDALRQGYAMQLGQQGNVGEILKMLTAAAAHENVPAGALVRIAQQLAGSPQMATPELDRSDAASNALGAGNALKSVGEGVDKLRSGGVGTPADTLNPLIQSILGGRVANVDPTSVEAARIKALTEGRPKITINDKTFNSQGAGGAQVSGPPDMILPAFRTSPDLQKTFPDFYTTLQQRGVPGSVPAAGLNNPPPMAPGTSVGPLPSTDASSSPAGPAGADSAVRPEHIDEYNRVLANQQQQGNQLGSVQPMGDGSLLIPRVQKNGTRDNLRIFRDPGQKNGYNTRVEPM